MKLETLQARANAVQWWHSGIDLGQGVITKGRSHPRENLLPYLDLPEDLTLKTVIDVCTWDGFMAFECERRHAQHVVAVDSFAWDRANSALTGHTTGSDGFLLAHRERQSLVQATVCEVLDLDPAKLGTFDIVLFLGVLYHMRHPLLALEKVAALTDGLLIVESHIDMSATPEPAMRFYPGAEINNDPTNWWGPNVACIEAMLRDVGFTQVTAKPAHGGRVVMHAWGKQ